MDFTPEGFKAKLLEFKTALESKDPAVVEKVIVENNPGVKDGDSFVQKVNAVASAVSDEINKATTQVGNAVGGAVNTAVANSHLEPTADNKFLYFIQNMFKTIMTFFNNSYQTISGKLNKSVDGNYSTSAWGSQEMGSTGITYGGAMAIGLASSFLIFIIYKILKRFRSKSVYETASSYNANLNNINSESNDMLCSLKNIILREGVSIEDKKVEIINNGRTRAIELISDMTDTKNKSTDESNKQESFWDKYKWSMLIAVLAIWGILAGSKFCSDFKMGYDAAYNAARNNAEAQNKYKQDWLDDHEKRYNANRDKYDAMSKETDAYIKAGKEKMDSSLLNKIF